MERKNMERNMQEKSIGRKTPKKERVRCPQCGNYCTPYLSNSDWCQKCYREVLEKYCYWKYNEKVERPKKGGTEEKVCEILISENLEPKKVIEKYGAKIGITSRNYVYMISQKYLVKCDLLGNKKPNIYRYGSNKKEK